MNNTAKGFPATNHRLTGHKNTKLQRRAHQDKAFKEWSENQVGLGARKRHLRKMAKLTKTPETKD